MFYDSMIAKLIVHGKDRADAIAKMREALNGFVIRGISSNIPFQSALLAHPDFQSGDFNTGFIAQHYPHGFVAEEVAHADPLFLVALAALIRRKEHARAAGITGQLSGHEVKQAADFVALVRTADGGTRQHVVQFTSFDARTGEADLSVDGQAFRLASPCRLSDLRHTGTVNGRHFVAQVERGTPRNILAYRLSNDGARADVTIVSPRAAGLSAWMKQKAPPDTSKLLLSPMPGLLVQVAVAVGQHVQAGERLAVIEAMKMENPVTAPRAGTVETILVAVGDAVTAGAVLVELAEQA
jgi:propionyl-CoA carboxylase alpha chain